jgi:hypothetical protein
MREVLEISYFISGKLNFFRFGGGRLPRFLLHYYDAGYEETKMIF